MKSLATRASLVLLLLASACTYFDDVIKLTERNFLVSDVLFILSALALFVDTDGGSKFLRCALRQPAALPLFLFLAVATVPLLPFSDTYLRLHDEEGVLFSVLQLTFCFFLLAPLVHFHTKDLGSARKLWRVHYLVVPLAALISISDWLGFTSLGDSRFYRYNNPLLGVNGFWVFGLISPFLLQECVASFPRARSLWFAGLWLLGFAGMALGGVRLGLVLTFLSVLWVLWWHRAALRNRLRAVTAGIVILCVVGGGGLYIIEKFPVYTERLEREKISATLDPEVWDAARTIGNRIALEAVENEPTWFGRGLKQSAELGLEMTIHLTYLQQLYETGFLGLATYLAAMAALLASTVRSYRQARHGSDEVEMTYWWCCLFVVVAYLVSGLFYPLGYSRSFWLPLFLGMGTESGFRSSLRRVETQWLGEPRRA